MKNSKITKKENLQDMVGILMANGHSLEQILGLGFIVPVEQDVKTMAVEKKENLYWMTQNLYTVISEVLKSPEERNVNKILLFLQMATKQADKFYKLSNGNEFLIHGLTPDFK